MVASSPRRCQQHAPSSCVISSVTLVDSRRFQRVWETVGAETQRRAFLFACKSACGANAANRVSMMDRRQRTVGAGSKVRALKAGRLGRLEPCLLRDGWVSLLVNEPDVYFAHVLHNQMVNPADFRTPRCFRPEGA
jgi:hypothetical protein